jgi:hypothetical protein
MDGTCQSQRKISQTLSNLDSTILVSRFLVVVGERWVGVGSELKAKAFYLGGQLISDQYVGCA